MPSGWPIAMAPPSTFTRSGSSCSSCTTASAWAANASFSSTRSRSRADSPARASALRVAGTGPIPISRGSTPAEAEATIRASGVSPSSRAFAPEATSTAAAPSFNDEELPAVTDPPPPNTAPRGASFPNRGSAHPGLARLDRGGRLRRGLQTAGAEPVHRRAGDRVGEPGEQHRHARHVAVVLARLVGAAEDHLVELLADAVPHALQQGAERVPG